MNLSAPEKKTCIYRFASIENVLRDLWKKQNTLVSPRKWDDPWENNLQNTIFRDTNSRYSFRDRCYGQCWTTTEESDATWRIYTPGKNGVRLKSTIEKVYRSLETGHRKQWPGDWKMTGGNPFTPVSCYIGKVEYQEEGELTTYFNNVSQTHPAIGSAEHANTLLKKRAAFRHEKEIRLIFLHPQNEGEGDFFRYEMDYSRTIEEICFGPRMSDDLFEMYSSILREFGFSGNIGRSTLYRVPEFMST